MTISAAIAVAIDRMACYAAEDRTGHRRGSAMSTAGDRVTDRAANDRA
jgi:hypothetical protein